MNPIELNQSDLIIGKMYSYYRDPIKTRPIILEILKPNEKENNTDETIVKCEQTVFSKRTGEIIYFKPYELVPMTSNKFTDSRANPKDFKTYEEWQKSGFQVLYGEKAVFIDGKHKFNGHQVESFESIANDYEFNPRMDY